ncbi:MAG: glutamate-5-semialdehyde dehydrogenase, partial [Deltaproteobacteria bacterium]|nr:glutamate-5-semialdehyde dehydrogenase [Deltaproteobacteria bacterium]
YAAAKAAKSAAIQLAATDPALRNNALRAIAEALAANRKTIFEANAEDLALSRENQLAEPLLKRLKFDDKKLSEVIGGIESLMDLPDPLGNTLSARELDHGLELYQVSCPIGVIGVIFESRPDALVQISTLCLKSGNAVLLKGGSEAAQTNRALADAILTATPAAGIPDGWLHLLETRADVNDMLKMDDDIDLLIPRGSNEFVKFIMEHSNIPVLGHADGICHVYVDADADISMARKITTDAKCQYTAVCNAAETLLVHDEIAKQFLPLLYEDLSARNVELRGCPKTASIIACRPALEEDWRTEYLDAILSIKVVSGTDEAVDHINAYGSGHTDTIVTKNLWMAKRFLERVDSGNVFWNCSTRFSDGYRYGLGAEVGIGTSKIHARGPVGLEGLLIYKWMLKGHGHTVAEYADGTHKFTHRKLNKAFSVD